LEAGLPPGQKAPVQARTRASAFGGASSKGGTISEVRARAGEIGKIQTHQGQIKAKAKSGNEPGETENHGPVKLLVRLYFSGHEKLSEQRWLDRIPAEEPFKSASPKMVREPNPLSPTRSNNSTR